ncbi:MAG: DUF3783 domain-containing protein [Treponema sp.]|jgi:N-acetylglucosamine kinase-like BadF-type ATPase|nr:DUF3783 domain-containing protein [Treponema sp.]
MNGPVVFMHGFEEDALFSIINAVKKAAADAGIDPADIAFSTSTLKNREWLVKKLLAEVRREHDYIRQENNT